VTTNAQLRYRVAEALRASLESSVTVYETPPDTVGSAAVILGGIDWQWSTMDDGRTVTVPLYVAVSRKNTNNVVQLDELCDPAGDVVSAFDANPTSDGIESWNVTSVGAYRDIAIGDTDYYAATVTIEIMC
jgi:hypothetical protein